MVPLSNIPISFPLWGWEGGGEEYIMAYFSNIYCFLRYMKALLLLTRKLTTSTITIELIMNFKPLNPLAICTTGLPTTPTHTTHHATDNTHNTHHATHHITHTPHNTHHTTHHTRPTSERQVHPGVDLFLSRGADGAVTWCRCGGGDVIARHRPAHRGGAVKVAAIALGTVGLYDGAHHPCTAPWVGDSDNHIEKVFHASSPWLCRPTVFLAVSVTTVMLYSDQVSGSSGI